MNANTTHRPNATHQSEKNLVTVVYALQAATFAIGITYFIAPVINYYKRSAVAGTWLESHFRWQLDTFWFSLIAAVIGIALMPLGLISLMILTGDSMWFVFRIVRGWSQLSRSEPV
jgi:uncharacterized membrane protein